MYRFSQVLEFSLYEKHGSRSLLLGFLAAQELVTLDKGLSSVVEKSFWRYFFQ